METGNLTVTSMCPPSPPTTASLAKGTPLLAFISSFIRSVSIPRHTFKNCILVFNSLKRLPWFAFSTQFYISKYHLDRCGSLSPFTVTGVCHRSLSLTPVGHLAGFPGFAIMSSTAAILLARVPPGLHSLESIPGHRTAVSYVCERPTAGRNDYPLSEVVAPAFTPLASYESSHLSVSSATLDLPILNF